METALTRLTGMGFEEKEKLGIVHTPEEICSQVELWSDTLARFEKRRPELSEFLAGFMKEPRPFVLCTGAGTSEFIGYCVEGLLRKGWRLPVAVVSTPRLVTGPQNYFFDGYAALLLSFARSGNSPESLGAVKMADMLSESIRHLVVTCNREGNLYREISARSERSEHRGAMALVLDEKTNDRGLAMTSSFSNMIVTAQMLGHLFRFEQYEARFGALLRAGRIVRDRAPEVVERISRLGFTRAVFLGDGANYGTAVESHLKLQELTSGRVMCAWDTFPGLRHGPEAVVDATTLVVAYLAADGYTQRYELDLLRELKRKGIGMAVLAVAHTATDEIKELCEYTIEYGPEADPVADELVPPVYVIVGQLLALFTSLHRGLRPDNPSESGIIHRVVQGVKVYDPLAYRRTGRLHVLAES